MAKLFVPLDVDYQDDPKIIRAGALAEILYVRSLARAKRLLTDGRIDAALLPSLALGIPGKATKHVDSLVREGLWQVVDGGWVIAAFLRRNNSASEVESKRTAKQEAAVKGNHERWHVDGKTSPDCVHCIADRSHLRSQTVARANRIGSPEPEPEPEPTSSSSRDATTTRSNTPDDDDFTRAAQTLAERDLKRREAERGPVGDRTAWLRTARTRREWQLDAWLNERGWPQLTATELVDRIEPDPTKPTITTPLGCEHCEDGWLITDHGARPCPHCQQTPRDPSEPHGHDMTTAT